MFSLSNLIECNELLLNDSIFLQRVSNASANFVNGLEEGGHLHFPLNQHFNEVISASDEEDPMKNDFEADDSSDEDEQEA